MLVTDGIHYIFRGQIWDRLTRTELWVVAVVNVNWGWGDLSQAKHVTPFQLKGGGTHRDMENT